MKPLFQVATLGILVALAGCKEDAIDASLPAPLTLTEEAAGHYCQMVILEHDGPKAQVFLDGMDNPLWFSQVRDGVAYLKSPEQSHEILGLYVNDMAKAKNWTEPGADNWILAREAFFVVGSSARGGMGAPEVVPFGTQEAAKAFATQKGGNILELEDIPISAVLGPIETVQNAEQNQ